MIKELSVWFAATDDIARAFTKRYFKTERFDKDTFWVADEIGGVFVVGDYFFNVDFMVTALTLKASFKKINTYYWAMVENPDAPLHTNFENYIKFGWIGGKPYK